MAKVSEEKSPEDNPGRYELEEALQNHLQRQEDQIENLMDMLIELKEKLESAAEKKEFRKGVGQFR